MSMLNRLRRILGFLLLLISTIAWFALPVIPFMDASVEDRAIYVSVTFIFAEITWWLCIPLLGKEIWALMRRGIDIIKSYWRA